MEPVKGERAQRDEVDRNEQPGGEPHRSALPPPPKAAGRLDARLASAAALAAVSYWIVIYASGGDAPSVFDLVASPLFHLGLAGATAATLWAAHLLQMEPLDSSRKGLRIVLVAAALFRLLALPASPVLSDDILRYRWDGHVQVHGVNPYLMAPDDPALDPLATSYRERINNPDLPTIYPPVAQIVFLAAALLPGGLLAVKILLVVFDMGTILALAAILRHRGILPARVVIYAWSPLAVIEVAWSGHVDPVGVCLLMVGALAIIKSRSALSISAVALSGAVKYLGWIALLPLGRRFRGRDLLWGAVAIAAVYAPYAAAGSGVAGSLLDYVERWRFNDSIFSLLLGFVEWGGFTESLRGLLLDAGWLDPAAQWQTSPALRLTEPLSLAKGIAALLFLSFAVRVLRRRWNDPLRETFALLGGALLLAPTLHPWYLLWVAPFLALFPRLSWIWLTYAVMAFAYPCLVTRGAGEEPLRWLAYVEYLPFYLLLVVESARRRLWERE